MQCNMILNQFLNDICKAYVDDKSLIIIGNGTDRVGILTPPRH